MTIGEQRICDVIAASPEAEDVLEEAGIDYWFGWERMLEGACHAAKVDPDELAARLISFRPHAIPEAQSVGVADLLSESDNQWKATLAPAIVKARASATALPDRRGATADRLLQELQSALEQHMATSRALLLATDAIEQGRAGSVDRHTVRSLRLEHLDLARMADDLRDEASRLAPDSDAVDLVAALRTVIREIHRHLKVAYNFILPRLTKAAARPVASEPW